MKSSDIKKSLLAQIRANNPALPITQTSIFSDNMNKVIESENQKITDQTMWEEDGIISNNEEE